MSFSKFQHTAARRRLRQSPWLRRHSACFNTQPPEGGCLPLLRQSDPRSRFNTQPPEGGCRASANRQSVAAGFNTQPPEGGCET